jgi:hypothetical protein
MDQPGPVDDRPSVSACSVETLRTSVGCLLDGRPAVASGEADRQRQARDNVALGLSLGESLCRERASGLDAEPKEQAARFQTCLGRVKLATRACALGGAEALLDAEGHFSTRAQSCYVGLAEAAQRVTVPDAPPPPPAARPEPPPSRTLSEAKQL